MAGFGLCGDYSYEVIDPLTGKKSEFEPFSMTVKPALIGPDTVIFSLDSSADGPVIYKDIQIEVGLKKFPKATPTLVDVRLAYRECKVVPEFVGPFIDD